MTGIRSETATSRLDDNGTKRPVESTTTRDNDAPKGRPVGCLTTVIRMLQLVATISDQLIVGRITSRRVGWSNGMRQGAGHCPRAPIVAFGSNGRAFG